MTWLYVVVILLVQLPTKYQKMVARDEDLLQFSMSAGYLKFIFVSLIH